MQSVLRARVRFRYPARTDASRERQRETLFGVYRPVRPADPALAGLRFSRLAGLAHISGGKHFLRYVPLRNAWRQRPRGGQQPVSQRLLHDPTRERDACGIGLGRGRAGPGFAGVARPGPRRARGRRSPRRLGRRRRHRRRRRRPAPADGGAHRDPRRGAGDGVPARARRPGARRGRLPGGRAGAGRLA